MTMELQVTTHPLSLYSDSLFHSIGHYNLPSYSVDTKSYITRNQEHDAHSRLVENCLLENNEFKTLDCDTGCVSDSESSIDDDEDSYQAMMENSRSEHLDDDEINMDCTSGDTEISIQDRLKSESDLTISSEEASKDRFKSPLPPRLPTPSEPALPSLNVADLHLKTQLSDNDDTRIPLYNGCEDHWSWNPKDKSHEVRLNGPNDRIAHFHPNWSNGTAGVRGTRVLNGGRYYWEINVSQRIFGTSMMFGIGTKCARLHVDSFVNMLGEDEQSWGLSHKGYIWQKGTSMQYTTPFRENVATTIGIYFDGNAGTLTYFKDNACLGVAFTGLNEISEPLYPMICSTAAKTEMSLGVMKREFLSMQDRCRATIIRSLTNEGQIEQLLLPRSLKMFIAEGLSENGNAADDLALNQNNILQQRNGLSMDSSLP